MLASTDGAPSSNRVDSAHDRLSEARYATHVRTTTVVLRKIYLSFIEPNSMKRRGALALLGAGLTGTGGCLRLVDGGESTPQESETPPASETPQDPSTATTSEGTPTSDGPNEVTLTEVWTNDNGVDNIWTREGTFYRRFKASASGLDPEGEADTNF